jgi:hypothetical protein
MAMLEVPLVNESGNRVGYGDRWWTHRVRKTPAEACGIKIEGGNKWLTFVQNAKHPEDAKA